MAKFKKSFIILYNKEQQNKLLDYRKMNSTDRKCQNHRYRSTALVDFLTENHLAHIRAQMRTLLVRISNPIFTAISTRHQHAKMDSRFRPYYYIQVIVFVLLF